MWSTARGFEGMDTIIGNFQARQERRADRQAQQEAEAATNQRLEGPEAEFMPPIPKFDLFDWDMGGNFWI